ncbi:MULTISPECIES: decarboxylase [unclassified Streptomyces]|uniref:aspartate racemase/maleate isomerase family protein n=1 Tax=unclassified Streptomyces TaxID=2593676 RepID=UPI001905F59C|nr:decarboxylase [Streptomyces sp. HSG2]
MTALGVLDPGRWGQEDYPRTEQLLGSDIRVDVVRADTGGNARDLAGLRSMGEPPRLTAGVPELLRAGVDAAVWASDGALVTGWAGAHETTRALAAAAGVPASSTALAFVHAARELRVRRIAVGATHSPEVVRLFVGLLVAGGLEVVAVHDSGALTAADAGAWRKEEVLGLAVEADRPDAEAVLLPDAALYTVSHLPVLEARLAKPVLTAHQVTVWEGLRLADRRVNAPDLGALFDREPIVQVGVVPPAP